MLIDNISVQGGADIFYDQKFMVVLEDHMTFLRNDDGTTVISVTVADAFKYEGDLFGLLHKLNIDQNFHWIVMRMNKYTSPTKSLNNLKNLIIPNFELIDRIRSLHLTSNKIKN